MGRTVTNITGDAACTMVVNAMEEKKEARLAAKNEA
jgi:Na+/H+-dicarboxylate symporter